MPRKALPAMAGLDRKVLNSRRITKRVAPSNPVFSRSFITSFDVASYNRSGMHQSMCSVPFFHAKKRMALGRLREMVYICSVEISKKRLRQ